MFPFYGEKDCLSWAYEIKRRGFRGFFNSIHLILNTDLPYLGCERERGIRAIHSASFSSVKVTMTVAVSIQTVTDAASPQRGLDNVRD